MFTEPLSLRGNIPDKAEAIRFSAEGRIRLWRKNQIASLPSGARNDGGFDIRIGSKRGDRVADLKELIRRVYIQSTCDVVEKSLRPILSSAHSKIVNSLKQSDTIITFNYDLVIEESFDKNVLDRWNPKHGYGVKAIRWC